MTVVAIACWAGAARDALGAGVVERALMLALPLTLALQWALRSRYLGRPHGRGPAALGAARCRAGRASALVVARPLALGPGGAVAGLLTLTWTGGTLLIRRRWAPAYAAASCSATGDAGRAARAAGPRRCTRGAAVAAALRSPLRAAAAPVAARPAAGAAAARRRRSAPAWACCSSPTRA